MVGLLMLCGTATAAECDALGVPSILQVTDWSAVPGEPNVLTTIKYRNVSAKPIVMVKASVWFFDALGERVIGFQINPDVKLAPGVEAEESGRLIGDHAQRLLSSDKALFQAIACTHAVVYADGTKETFD